MTGSAGTVQYVVGAARAYTQHHPSYRLLDLVLGVVGGCLSVVGGCLLVVGGCVLVLEGALGYFHGSGVTRESK